MITPIRATRYSGLPSASVDSTSTEARAPGPAIIGIARREDRRVLAVSGLEGFLRALTLALHEHHVIRHLEEQDATGHLEGANRHARDTGAEGFPPR